MPKSGKSRGLARVFHARISVEAARVVADAYSIPTSQIMSGERAKATVVLARQLAMYLAHVVGQMSLGQVSEHFGRDRTTVGYSCHVIEDRRDGPVFDKQVDELERMLSERLTSLLTQESRARATLPPAQCAS